jgi:succinate-acetate transporter protein
VRFSSRASAVVLAVVLLVAGVARPLALGLLASQVAVFGFTALVSFQWSVWAHLFARVVWPRLGAPGELQDAGPHRFAQLVAFVLTATALVGFLLDLEAAGYGLTALVFAAAALNALTGVCLACAAFRWTGAKPGR